MRRPELDGSSTQEELDNDSQSSLEILDSRSRDARVGRRGRQLLEEIRQRRRRVRRPRADASGRRNRQHGQLLDHRRRLTMPITGSIDVSAPGTTTATALVSGLAPGMYTVTMTATSSDAPDLYGHGAVHGRRGPDRDGERHPAVQPDPHHRLGRHQRPDRPVPVHHGRLGVAAAGAWSAARSTSPSPRRSSTRATPITYTWTADPAGDRHARRERRDDDVHLHRGRRDVSSRSRCLTASAATA